MRAMILPVSMLLTSLTAMASNASIGGPNDHAVPERMNCRQARAWAEEYHYFDDDLGASMGADYRYIRFFFFPPSACGGVQDVFVQTRDNKKCPVGCAPSNSCYGKNCDG